MESQQHLPHQCGRGEEDTEKENPPPQAWGLWMAVSTALQTALKMKTVGQAGPHCLEQREAGVS